MDGYTHVIEALFGVPGLYWQLTGHDFRITLVGKDLYALSDRIHRNNSGTHNYNPEHDVELTVAYAATTVFKNEDSDAKNDVAWATGLVKQLVSESVAAEALLVTCTNELSSMDTICIPRLGLRMLCGNVLDQEMGDPMTMCLLTVMNKDELSKLIHATPPTEFKLPYLNAHEHPYEIKDAVVTRDALAYRLPNENMMSITAAISDLGETKLGTRGAFEIFHAAVHV
jgi:hypothetical protein